MNKQQIARKKKVARLLFRCRSMKRVVAILKMRDTLVYTDRRLPVTDVLVAS